MKTATRETRSLTELLGPEKRATLAPTRWQRLKATWVGVLAALLPQIPIPGYCSCCWTRLDLVHDQQLSGSGQDLIRGVRLWRCPTCHSSVNTWYCYMYYQPPWE